MKVADDSVCRCAAPKAALDVLHSSCGDCHATCRSCELAGDRTQCTTCPGETGTGTGAVGTCTCLYKLKATVTEECCSSGCEYCYDSGDTDCTTQEVQDFVYNVQDLTNLPYAAARTDLLMCFRQPPSETTCTPDPVETVVGSITGDYPTTTQCLKLLTAEWPFLMHWFEQLFTGYSDPSYATDAQLRMFKPVFYLWILHFGPSEMLSSEWDPLRTALSAGGAWNGYLAWAGETPQYTVNGWDHVTDFPAVLSDWIKSSEGCNKARAGCIDLLPFNYITQLCGAGCGHQTECDLALETHVCTS